jgi:type 1 glutamine amidotransferase
MNDKITLLKTISIIVVFTIFFSLKEKQSRILVFSKTLSYRHASIEVGKKCIRELGLKNGFRADTTENCNDFNDKNLKKYDAVVFLNTSGDVLDEVQQESFKRFIKSGKGFIGIHGASDTEYDWPWYGKLVGAYFTNHPLDPNVRKGVYQVVDKIHPACKHLPERWEREDEFYNFKDINPSIKVLLNIDEKSYEGGKNGENHPMSWCHEYDGGRSFYTNLGHTEASYSDPLYKDHLLGGIKYVLQK